MIAQEGQCTNCGVSWDSDGLLDFTKTDLYWNQFSSEIMSEVIKRSRDVGWRHGVDQAIGTLDSKEGNPEYLKNYIVGENRADWIVYTNVSEDSRVLDIGSGWGAVANQISTFCREVWATDTNRDNLEFQRIRFQQERRTNIRVARVGPLGVERLPFAEASFDLVVMNGVLEWIGCGSSSKGPRQIQLDALRDLRRVLKPSGQLYVGIENRYYVRNFSGIRLHGELPFMSVLPRVLANFFMKNIKHEEHRTYIYGLYGYHRLFEEAGFDQTEILWPIPSYHDPRTIVPLSSTSSLRHYVKYLMARDSLRKRIIGRLPSTSLMKAIGCHSFGFILEKPHA